MKQTAVEWLHEKLATSELEDMQTNINVWFQQAKEMEKEQQGYSEEEVINFLQEMNDWPTTFEGRIDIREWFEQFKKK
jgi:hypothetical protein